MTGYASAQLDLATPYPLRLGLEIRSVNSRFLDLTFKLPEEFRAQEPALRELLSRRLKRGKVELRATFERSGHSVVAPGTDFLAQLPKLELLVRQWLPDAAGLTVGEVLRISESQQISAKTPGAELLDLAARALHDLLDARAREGARLSDMLFDRIQQLRQLTQEAQPLIPLLVDQQRQKFLDRWREAMALTDGSALPDAVQDRALSEATAFAIRIDVDEEMTRLHAHLDEATRLLRRGGELGKRLDFLIQELHREANTLGAKSAALELTRISVDMKVLIEQMREQVQNIE
jgi:uncharacterized protein (TIGR00255 family)